MGVPNEAALLNKKETTERMEEFLNKVNSGMDNYKKIEKVVFVKDEWTPDNNLTTPTLKIKRAKIDERFSEDYENWFKHEESILWE